jgi:hypothetical protein
LGASKTQPLDAGGDGAGGQGQEKKSVMAEMFADRKVRLLVVSTFVLQMAQQFSG